MNDESIEKQLASLPHSPLAADLRNAVLRDAQRELRAARRDRQLGRAAVLLVVIGIGLNFAVSPNRSSAGKHSAPLLAKNASRQPLVDTAIIVTEATDAATGSRFAKQLAALTGRNLTHDESAAIGGTTKVSPHHEADHNKG